MKATLEGKVELPKAALHLLKVDGRVEVHRIPAGNTLTDHSPRACQCGPKVEFRNTRFGPVWAHDHALLGAAPESFLQ